MTNCVTVTFLYKTKLPFHKPKFIFGHSFDNYPITMNFNNYKLKLYKFSSKYKITLFFAPKKGWST